MIKAFSNIRDDMVVPFLWAQEEVTVTKEQSDELKWHGLYLLIIFEAAIYGAMICGVLLAVISAVKLYKKKVSILKKKKACKRKRKKS